MARIEIRLDQIGQYTRGQVSLLIETGTLEAEGRLKRLTPVDTGRLRSNWQTQVEELKGSVSNNLPYAGPVIAGVDLPPSWGGKYRTRQGAEPFLDIVAKDLQTWLETQARRIARDS